MYGTNAHDDYLLFVDVFYWYALHMMKVLINFPDGVFSLVGMLFSQLIFNYKFQQLK